MKLAAIDIGSNAVRLQVTKVLEYEERVTFKKLEYVRFPLRLGKDVFTTGRVGEYNKERFYKLMTAYKNLIDLYEIDAFFGCATSAMRESKNGEALISQIKEDLGLDIKIISGDEEAEMINKVIMLSIGDENYLHIDVGGGSTELNIYENRKKILSRSFKLGSVRRLQQTDSPEVWGEMQKWVEINVLNRYDNIISIGTGGNINKLFELSQNGKSKEMTFDTLVRTQQRLRTLSVEDMLNKLQLNPDRADVIIPASEIYIGVMEAANSQNILVPDVGLKDGINYHMYEMHHPTSNKVFVKN